MSYTPITYPHAFLGIDPGLTGGLVLLSPEGAILGKAVMPIREDRSIAGDRLRGLLPWPTEWDDSQDAILPVFAICEKTWAFPGQGVVSSFTFGRVSGHAIGAAEALLGHRVYEVSPQTWMRTLFPAGFEDSKMAAREFVARTWPNESFLATKRSRKPHQGLVDGACLAEFGRRHWKTLSG